MDKPMSDLEEILSALYESEINASISWLWDGGIDLQLGDELNGYDADGQVRTLKPTSRRLFGVRRRSFYTAVRS